MDTQRGKRVRNTRRRAKGENTARFAEKNIKKNTKLENPRPWWVYTDFALKIDLDPPQTGYQNEQKPSIN